jgi:hypothetical protein
MVLELFTCGSFNPALPLLRGSLAAWEPVEWAKESREGARDSFPEAAWVVES